MNVWRPPSYPFRYEDPFRTKHGLEYNHIFQTKHNIWNYQYFLVYSLCLIIALNLVIRAFIVVYRYFSSGTTKKTYGTPTVRAGFVRRQVIKVHQLLASEPQIPLLKTWFNTWTNLLIVVAFYAVNFTVLFVHFQIDDSFNFALRTGLIAGSNVPLLYLVPLKSGPLLHFLNVSYENVLVYHKWIGILVLLFTFLHVIAFVYALAWQYLFTKFIPLTGWFILSTYLAITMTSFAFVRTRYYEFFYYTHIVSALAFLPVFAKHHHNCKPFTMLTLYALLYDRIVRWIWYYWCLQCKVSIITGGEDNNYLIISIDPKVSSLSTAQKIVSWCMLKFNNRRFKWQPSNHLFIQIPAIKWLEAHPFTIASIQEDGKAVLLIKVYNGFTGKLYNQIKESGSTHAYFTCFIHGAYGMSHAHLPEVESVKNLSPGTRSRAYELIEDPSGGSTPTASPRSDSSSSADPDGLQYTTDPDDKDKKDPEGADADTKTRILPTGSSLTMDTLATPAPSAISDEKIILCAGGVGSALTLPLLQYYYRSDYNVSFIWICRHEAILNAVEFTPNDKVTVWCTSKQGRPDIQQLLFDTIDAPYKKLHIIGCGAHGLMVELRKFGVKSMENHEVNIVLEEFTF